MGLDELGAVKRHRNTNAQAVSGISPRKPSVN
jgi:hypothetical protein